LIILVFSRQLSLNLHRMICSYLSHLSDISVSPFSKRHNENRTITHFRLCHRWDIDLVTYLIKETTLVETTKIHPLKPHRRNHNIQANNLCGIRWMEMLPSLWMAFSYIEVEWLNWVGLLKEREYSLKEQWRLMKGLYPYYVRREYISGVTSKS
jgi:hypothetical protein